MFFYRDDGLYAFYDVRPDGSLGAKLSGGTGYTKGSSSIAAIDLNGDNKDDLFSITSGFPSPGLTFVSDSASNRGVESSRAPTRQAPP